MTRQLPPGAHAICQGYEGIGGQRGDRFFIYHCAADKPGVYTIGRGHVVSAVEHSAGILIGDEVIPVSQGLTLEQVNHLYEKDMSARLARLEKHVPVATDNEFGALACLFFNHEGSVVSGTPGKEHRAGHKVAAARAFLLYNMSGGKRRRGLWRRRGSECLYYLTGEVLVAKSDEQEEALFARLAQIGQKFVKPKGL